MRKITQEASDALRGRYSYKNDNTVVKHYWKYPRTQFAIEIAEMYLHGNQIATYDGESLYLQDCGWRTVTTKERLNGVLTAFGSQWRIYQINKQWRYSDGMGVSHEWNGTLTIKDGE